MKEEMKNMKKKKRKRGLKREFLPRRLKRTNLKRNVIRYRAALDKKRSDFEHRQTDDAMEATSFARVFDRLNCCEASATRRRTPSSRRDPGGVVARWLARAKKKKKHAN